GQKTALIQVNPPWRPARSPPVDKPTAEETAMTATASANPAPSPAAEPAEARAFGDGSRLQQRIAMLERILSQEAGNGVDPGLLRAMLERLALLERMVARIGVDEARSPLVGLLVREAEAN